MKFIIIVGPGAVGKMTVGQELSKITNFKLLHNHMTIELVLDVFGEFNGNAILKIRDLLIDEFLKSNKEGLIMTMIWGFDLKEDWDIMNSYYDKITSVGGEFYVVELEASQEVRLERNNTENRLKNKPSKRNIEISNKRVIDMDIKYRQNSFEGEVPFKNYLKINNESLSAEEVAKIVKEKFEF